MTEAEWLACDEPGPMLEFIRDKSSGRKLRLFACACSRRAWGLLSSRVCREGIEASERYADGLASADELRDARRRARESAERALRKHVRAHAWSGVVQGRLGRGLVVALCAEDARVALQAVDAGCVTGRSAKHYEAKRVEEGQRQAGLLRDVVGSPFRAALPLASPAEVVTLAHAAYDERLLPSGHLDPAHLGVLADALEEVGCTDTDILTHLRSPGPHVRGCWAIDLVLGKE